MRRARKSHVSVSRGLNISAKLTDDNLTFRFSAFNLPSSHWDRNGSRCLDAAKSGQSHNFSRATRWMARSQKSLFEFHKGTKAESRSLDGGFPVEYRAFAPGDNFRETTEMDWTKYVSGSTIERFNRAFNNLGFFFFYLELQRVLRAYFIKIYTRYYCYY